MRKGANNDMPEETIGFYMKAEIMRNIATFFGVGMDAPSRRELVIQINRLKKLERAFRKKYAKKLTTALSGALLLEDIRRQMAHDRHRLTLQSRLVDDLFSRVVEEIHLQVFPNVKPVVRKNFKKKSREFTAQLNRLMNQHLTKIRADRYAKAEAVVATRRSAHRLP